MYEEIKKNIIEGFFNTHYLWTCCVNKNIVFENMKTKCPFDINVIEHGNIIQMNLGNDIVISFNFKWEEHQTDKFTNYRLINIS